MLNMLEEIGEYSLRLWDRQEFRDHPSYQQMGQHATENFPAKKRKLTEEQTAGRMEGIFPSCVSDKGLVS